MTDFYVEEVKRAHNCKLCRKRLEKDIKRVSIHKGYYNNHAEYWNVCSNCGLKIIKEKLKEIGEAIKQINELPLGKKKGTILIPAFVSIKEYEEGIEIKPYKQERIKFSKELIGELVWLLKKYSSCKLYSQKELEEEIDRRILERI